MATNNTPNTTTIITGTDAAGLFQILSARAVSARRVEVRRFNGAGFDVLGRYSHKALRALKAELVGLREVEGNEEEYAAGGLLAVFGVQ